MEGTPSAKSWRDCDPVRELGSTWLGLRQDQQSPLTRGFREARDRTVDGLRFVPLGSWGIGFEFREKVGAWNRVTGLWAEPRNMEMGEAGSKICAGGRVALGKEGLRLHTWVE